MVLWKNEEKEGLAPGRVKGRERGMRERVGKDVGIMGMMKSKQGAKK